MTQPLEGKIALVTGSSRGLGRSHAVVLAEHGADVIVHDILLEEAEETLAMVRQIGREARLITTDIRDVGVFQEAVRDAGRVDILVNNAGRSIRRSVMHSLDRFHDYQRTMQLNYFGAIRLAMNLIPAMQARGQGHVINVSTMGVQSAPARFSAYLGSKSALEGWTLAAQNELVHTGVEFTLMNYPLVRTPMIAPTAIYRYVPAMSEERAVDWLCEAIVTRPKRKVPAFGLASQVMYQVLPKTSELIVNTSFQLLRDKRR